MYRVCTESGLFGLLDTRISIKAREGGREGGRGIIYRCVDVSDVDIYNGQSILQQSLELVMVGEWVDG